MSQMPAIRIAGGGGDSSEGSTNEDAAGGAGQPGGAAGQASRHRWGYSSPQASIGFERDVLVRVQAERIVVGHEPPIPCGAGETSRQLSLAVIRSLERDARSWNRPPQNFYWVPNVKFIISPGGNQHYERIKDAMGRHGLLSSTDFRLDTEIPKLPGILGSPFAESAR